MYPDWRTRVLQVLGIILTAGLGCYALARYFTSPIGKLRRATQKFAAGDLQTRVASEIGNRRDEVAKLAEDFDEMAERIESLVTAEKRLTQDISHELRSPLTRLNVALELARAKANVETQSLLTRIETESFRLERNDFATSDFIEARNRLGKFRKTRSKFNDIIRADCRRRRF